MCYICGNSADFYIVLHDLILSISIACRVQRTRCTMMRFSLIDSDINWLCLKCVYSRGYLDSLILILLMKWLYKKSSLVPCLMRKRSLMQDCSEKLSYTVIIDISMVAENARILGISKKVYIYIYIWHFVIPSSSYISFKCWRCKLSKLYFMFSEKESRFKRINNSK